MVDNPASGEIAADLAVMDRAQLDRLIVGAADAGRSWAATKVAERIDLCGRFLAAFEARSEEIAGDITAQMGKPIAQSRAEVGGMADRVRFMMSAAETSLADYLPPPLPGFDRRIERVPVGTVLNIAAWNYPLLIAVNAVVPAVLAGNSVLLKHSRRTPLCGFHFERAFTEAGAPEGLVAAVTADHEATAEMIARSEIGYVAFTGSVDGGREVSRAAAGRFIDVGLELGGKDPAYVRADADLEFTAANLAEGSFYNAGQSCCGVERIYVEQSVYADFLALLEAAAAQWVPADPGAETSTLGPMAQAGATAELTQQLDDAVAKGARVVCGGNSAEVGGRGRYFEATVVADATHEMALMREESFGPIVGVCPVDGDEEALGMMNDCRYGLAASLWTRDVDVAHKLADGVEAGSVLLNRCDYLDPALPWSGWKDSGVGITLSHLGFDRMTRTRGRHFRLP